jgi:Zn-dependent oligopeptidase
MRTRASSLVALIPVFAFFTVSATPLVAQTSGQPSDDGRPTSDPAYPAGLDAAMLARLVDARLAEARVAVDRLVAVQARRTVANTLRPYDDALNAIQIAERLARIGIQLHPDAAVRAEGSRAEERVSRVRADVAVDPRVAAAFAALDTKALTPEEQLLVARVRRDYHHAAADRDEATRTRLRALFETHDRLSAEFRRNLAAGGAAAQTTQGPYRQGWPANGPVLDSLLRVREEIAHLAGSRDWASYQAEKQMAGSTTAIRAFLERLRSASEPARKAAAARYLARLQREDPSITRLRMSDVSRAGNLIRREQFAIDQREVRDYFPFERVKQGVLAVGAEFFDVEFHRVDIPVWHPSVEAYEVKEQGRLIGRLYLDVHARPEKIPQGLGATLAIRGGITGRQLPEAILIASLPGGNPADPGLAPDQIRTFFHELGHAMNVLLSSRPYVSTSGMPEEVDFGEVASMALEDLVSQPAVLRRLSGHVRTGMPIPDDLMKRLHDGEAFSRPMQVGSFLAMATVSLEMHERPAREVNPDALSREAFAADMGVDLDPDMHFPASTAHLGTAAYSSNLYTFLSSPVIAKDLWSAFDPENPLDPKMARRYRDTILRPGKSRPASELVRDFLGRPFNLDAWQRWLEGIDRPQRVRASESVTREIAASNTHEFRVALNEHQAAHVIVNQLGVDVVVAVSGPDGEPIIEMDSPNGSDGPESVWVIASKSGDYTFRVRPLERTASGRYEFRVETIRDATAEDRTRVRLQRALVSGTRALERGGRENRLAAAKDLKEAFAAAVEIKDMATAAAVGTSFVRLDPSAALDILRVSRAHGATPLYFSRGFEQRAREMRERLERATRFFDSRLNVAPKVMLAVLSQADWTALTSFPRYPVPWSVVPSWSVAPDRAALVTVPAGREGRGQIAAMMQPGALPADVVKSLEATGLPMRDGLLVATDGVMYHELGHTYADAVGLPPRANWLIEFFADYLWVAYFADGSVDPRVVAYTNAWRTWRLSAHPTHTSLDDFDRLYFGVDNYGWYQAQFEKRAEEVYKTQGLAFLERVKEVLPPTDQPIAVDEALKRLEQVSPGFIAWAASLSAANQPASPREQPPVSDPVYPAGLDPAMLARLVDGHLANARAGVDRLVAVQGPRTAANTLRPFDEASNELKLADRLTAIAAELHPDSAIRAAGHRAEERISRFRSEFAADPGVARAFVALDTKALTPEEQLLVARVRRDYHRGGADLDEATRKRFRALAETLDRLSNEFQRNIAGDTTRIPVKPDELAGMPPEWIAAHDRDEQGQVILTTSYSDIAAITGYSVNLALRRRMSVAFYRRGWPANRDVLASLLHVREEIAHLAGSRDWAAYQAETRMAGSSEAIRTFINRLTTAAEPARKRLTARFLERIRREDKSAARLQLADAGYAAELIRREEYSVDKRTIRAYFPFERVKQGVLAVGAEFFGLEFRKVDVPVWHPSVEAYEARERGRLIGRFYLDLHPRPNKVPFGATYDLRDGIAGRQLPEVVLIARLPGGEPGDPGLMDVTGVTGVTTFFHEFGHVMHFLLATRPYMSTGGLAEELDFSEVPSQMLEEFILQPSVLRRLSAHVDTGASIPDDLLKRMQEADAFSRPMPLAQAAALSTLSLELHDRAADSVDPDAIARRAFADADIDLDPEMHMAAAFEHVGNTYYSATYYTFLWSQVIAKDLWSAFDRANPLDPAIARRYRDTILRPGKSRPASELVRDFLGRPFNLDAWQRWLEGK